MEIRRTGARAKTGRDLRGDARAARAWAPPEGGFTLVEVTTALSVFAVLILSVTLTLARGIDHRRESFLRYRAYSALRSIVAEVQETANLPQDLAGQKGVGALYVKYHQRTFPVPDLPSGVIAIEVFANETNVPPALGGPQDLNFDGDAQDNLQSPAAGPDLKLVPMQLTLTFSEGEGAHTIRAHRLITRTAGN